MVKKVFALLATLPWNWGERGNSKLSDPKCEPQDA